MRPISMPASSRGAAQAGKQTYGRRMTVSPSALSPTLSRMGRGRGRWRRSRRRFLLLAAVGSRRRRSGLWSSPLSPWGRGWWGLRRPAPLSRRRGCGFRILALLRQHGDELINRHIVGAFRHHDLCHHAILDGFVFHRRLVGLDLGDHVTGLDRFAFLLQPFGEVALFHRGRQRRHEDVDGHGGNLTGNVSGNKRPSPLRRLRRPTAVRAFPDSRHRASARPCR